MIGLALLCALGATPALDLEKAARQHVLVQFERLGRKNPELDKSLDAAAKLLAERALNKNAAAAAELVTLTQAVSLSGGWDPPPRALVLRGSPRDEPWRELKARTDLASESATHLGLSVLEDGEKTAIVLLLADRKAELEPFPRKFAQPVPPRPLCLTMIPRLTRMELYVTRPKGDVDRIAATESGGRFCANVGFGLPGRHTVEVLARGDKGPEVAALFFVQVGAEEKEAFGRAVIEPKTVPEGRQAVLSAINALRLGFGSEVLAPDPALDEAAQAYAERMAKEDFFAHVAPDGSDLRKRLGARDYRYTAAGENLGMASGPLAAHFGIEHSPGHRKNTLDPAFSVAGIGIAQRPDKQVVLVEFYAHPLAGAARGKTPLEMAYAAINDARVRGGLAPLERNQALEALATEHAGRALGMDVAKIDLPGVPRIHDRIFAARSDIAKAAADFFVADNPTLITDSKNLGDKSNALVGVGLVKGDSEKHGKSRFWIVVIYAQLSKTP
jgi:uncharacterized protein YkwD